MEQSNQFKVFVSVTADFDTDGNITPLSFVWEDGHRYSVDRVLDVRTVASLKAGGLGIRFTCMVHGKQTYLYLDEYRWYMERK